MMRIGCLNGVLRTRPRTGGIMGHPVGCKAFDHITSSGWLSWSTCSVGRQKNVTERPCDGKTGGPFDNRGEIRTERWQSRGCTKDWGKGQQRETTKTVHGREESERVTKTGHEVIGTTSWRYFLKRVRTRSTTHANREGIFCVGQILLRNVTQVQFIGLHRLCDD